MTSTAKLKDIPLDTVDHENWIRLNRDVVRLGMDWFRLLLEDYIQALRSGSPSEPDSLNSAVMSDLTADWLIQSMKRPQPFVPSNDVQRARDEFDRARTLMKEKGFPSPLDRLGELLGLVPFDQDVLMLGLAPFVEAGFAPLLGYAHDRLNINQGTPHLALALFAGGDEASVFFSRERFSPKAPLRRFALLEMGLEAPNALTPFQLNERVARLLLGEEYCDPVVESLLMPIAAGQCPEKHENEIRRLARMMEVKGLNAGLILGPRRCGRHVAAARLAASFGLGSVELRTHQLAPDPEQRRSQFARLSREAIMGRAAVVIDLTRNDNPAFPDHGAISFRAAEDALRDLESLVILISDETPDLPRWLPRIRLAPLTTEDRIEIWSRETGPDSKLKRRDIEALSEHFALGPGEIASVCRMSESRDTSKHWSVCRELAERGMDQLADKIESNFTWDDLLLPEEIMQDLKAITAQIRFRPRVYGEGGFGRKLVRGRGVSALFAGPSGVGKTMAAEVIANDLGLGLYKIDLSSVISKYIGETEKNLKRVFDAAEAGGAVLFFDEADALFGKRSEVKDSHDRYANIEISYLLQRMETYSGLSILATNMKSHIDVAFLRRLRFVIDVPFPNSSLREAIWRRAFPEETRTEGLDFARLARLELAGGNIVVIAVNAAFLAAAEGEPVRMRHIAQAARSEMRKLDQAMRFDLLEGT